MNPIYKLRHKIQMLKDFLQLLSTGPVTSVAKVCPLLEWCFIISIVVSGDHFQLRCAGLA